MTHNYLLLRAILHVCMELELVGHKSDRKVALGDPVPASFECHLVAGQPTVIAHHCCTMNGCTIDVVVNVTAKVYVVTLVASLDLSTLLAGRM